MATHTPSSCAGTANPMLSAIPTAAARTIRFMCQPFSVDATTAQSPTGHRGLLRHHISEMSDRKPVRPNSSFADMRVTPCRAGWVGDSLGTLLSVRTIEYAPGRSADVFGDPPRPRKLSTVLLWHG